MLVGLRFNRASQTEICEPDNSEIATEQDVATREVTMEITVGKDELLKRKKEGISGVVGHS